MIFHHVFIDFYRSQEFIRVGYYVNNDYEDPEMHETPPTPPKYDLLKRNILASSPRVTKFKINWDDGKKSSSSIENQPPPSENSCLGSGDARSSGFGNGLMDSPLKSGLPSTIQNMADENSSSLNQPIPNTLQQQAAMDIDM